MVTKIFLISQNYPYRLRIQYSTQKEQEIEKIRRILDDFRKLFSKPPHHVTIFDDHTNGIPASEFEFYDGYFDLFPSNKDEYKFLLKYFGNKYFMKNVIPGGTKLHDYLQNLQ